MNYETLRIICLLLAMVPDQRTFGSFLKDEGLAYRFEHEDGASLVRLQPEALSELLQHIPMP